MEWMYTHPRVEYVPPVSEDDLLAVMKSMDVLIVPYDPEKSSVAIMTTNSKTFQYVAAGRPIVISDLKNYVKMPPGVIYRARRSNEFLALIRRAQEEDCEEYRCLRADIAANNTWDIRGQQLLEAIVADCPELNGAISRPHGQAI
jgi:hypothetical protein